MIHCMPLCILVVILLHIKVSIALQWTSSGTLQDNRIIPICDGKDVTLAWNYSTSPDEHLVDVEWRYKNQNGTTHVVATAISGNFQADPVEVRRLQHVPNTGIKLLGVTPDDSGTYSVNVNVNVNAVNVNVNVHGSIVTYVQSANLTVIDPSILTGGRLRANYQGARYDPTTQEHNLILEFGTFDSQWTDQLDVVWTLPLNRTLSSTSRENGQYMLKVPNPFVGGEYTCQLDNASVVALCLQSNSPLRGDATILVDYLEGRLTLAESEMQTLKDELQNLNNDTTGLQGQVQDIKQQEGNHGSSHHTPIRLVGGSNSNEGRVEIEVRGGWGTICDDEFDANAAKVACRQLGLPRYSSSHVGF